MKGGSETKFFVAVHALIRLQGEFLIVRRCKNANYGASRWELPGGIVEPGETVEEALIRETREETGLTIEISRLIHVYTNLDSLPKRQHIEITYLCAHKAGDVLLAPNEHDEFEWVILHDLLKTEIPLRDFLADLLSNPDTVASVHGYSG